MLQVIAIFFLASVTGNVASGQSTTSLSPIHSEAGAFVDAKGEKVILQGVNLGSWLLIENWMLGIDDISDQHTLLQILDERFGRKKREELIDIFRSGWINERDFEMIQSFGMNTVRLPFHHSLLIDLGSSQLFREEGFAWIDYAISQAKKHNLYIILDLHGAPGGQSSDQPTGRIGRSQLWESTRNQDLTVAIWEEIGRRYQNESAIAAYDLLNEPYGDGPRSRITDVLSDLCERCYNAIRATGDRHVVLFPATQSGFFFYPNLSDRDYYNIGFTEHFYPGVFHDEASISGHARFIAEELVGRREWLRDFGAPFLVGEFNVIWRHTGGDRMMRYYWDLYASYGWASTMWSYKLIKDSPGVSPNNWYMVTNQGEIDIPDFRIASYEKVTSFMRGLGTMDLAIDTQLVDAFRNPNPEPLELPEYEQPLRTSPAHDELAGWQQDDIYGATPAGGLEIQEDGTLLIYGGGGDIFEKHDDFYYMWRNVDAPFVFEAKFVDLETVEPYSKSGLMLRVDNRTDSPMILFNVFKDGSVAISHRTETNGTVLEKKLPGGDWPVSLRIEYASGIAFLSVKRHGENWELLEEVPFDARTAGIATVSGNLNQLAQATVRNLIFTSYPENQ